MEKLNYVKLGFVERYDKEFVSLSHEDYCVQKEGHLDWILNGVIYYPYSLENKPKLVEDSENVSSYEDYSELNKRELVIRKASFLLFHLAAGHIFIEANKRISVFVFVTFLRLNGFDAKESDSLMDGLFKRIILAKTSSDILFNLVIQLAGCEDIGGKKTNCVKYKNPEDIIDIIEGLVI